MIRRFLGQSLMMAMLFAIVFCLTGHAQLSNGTIRGTVSDSKGAVLQNATVVLVNQGTAQQTTQPTNKEGYYTFPALGPGDYTVKVIVPGFDAWEVKLTLRVAQEAVIDAKLIPGTVKETVTVTDATPAVDMADGTLSDVKTSTQIDTLPVVSSNFLNILNFMPGVVANNYGNQGGGYTRVNGVPGGSFTFLVDGETANDRYNNELVNTPQALQTIKELKVTTSNANAEYSTPGVADIVTKGGTNQFHGQVHELYQTGGLEAWGFNQKTSSTQTHPHLVHNEFGGQVGGPVLFPKLYNGRNKTFFYFDYEKQIQHSLELYLALIPQKNWEQGDFSDYVDTAGNPVNIYDPLSGVYTPCSGSPCAPGTDVITRQQFDYNGHPNTIDPGRIDPIAQKIMALMPTPNENLTTPSNQLFLGGRTFNYSDPNSFESIDITRYTGKGDQYIGKNLLSGRFTYVNQQLVEPDIVDGHKGGGIGLLNPRFQNNAEKNGVLSLTSPIGGRMINEARLGINLTQSYAGPQPQPNVMSEIGLAACCTYPGLISWPGMYWYDNNQAFTISYIDRDNPNERPNQDVTLADNFSWTKAKHEMKFGFQVTNTRVTTTEFQSPGGDYFTDGNFTAAQASDTTLSQGIAADDTGSGIADLLLGEIDASQYNQVPVFHTRQTDYDGYAQDNFKMSPRLTLNLGVRWEYWSPYTDAGGLSTDLDFTKTVPCTLPIALVTGASVPGDSTIPCVTAGTPGFPAWFQQTTPVAVIPDSGKGQNPAVIASNLAAGVPLVRATADGFPSSLWNMPKNNWAPRLGFAYQLDDKTVIRGGYGIFYWTIPLSNYHANTRDDVPWAAVLFNYTDSANTNAAELGFPFAPTSEYQSQSGLSQGPLPAGYGLSTTLNPRLIGQDFVTPSINAYYSTGFYNTSGGWAVAPWDPNYRAQHAQEWNLTVERSLPGNWAAKVSYIGNHGGNLTNNDPVNANLPRELVNPPGGSPYPVASSSNLWETRPYPIYGSANLGAMDKFQFNGYSNHNEVRGEISHTFRGSFLLQSYYSFARSLGTSEGTPGSYGALELPPAAITNNAPLTQRLKMIYAPDSYMAEQNFVINGHYELPFGKGKQFLAKSSTAVNEIVSGWNASFFYIWHSGLFFSPYYSANPGIGGAEYIIAPGAINGGILPRGQRTRAKWFNGTIWDPCGGASYPACTTTAYAGQTFEKRDNPLDRDFPNGIPRNYMTGPGFSNADGTLYKMTPIGDHVKFDLEVQVFNVFNHTNLPNPGNNGSITSFINTPRLPQFQGKIIF
jgi:hypothetical protein